MTLITNIPFLCRVALPLGNVSLTRPKGRATRSFFLFISYSGHPTDQKISDPLKKDAEVSLCQGVKSNGTSHPFVLKTCRKGASEEQGR